MANASYYLDMLRRTSITRAAPNVLNYMKYRTTKRGAVTSIRRYTPQIAGLLLTKRCNLDCSFCNVGTLRHDDGDWREREADLDTVKRIFESPLFAKCLLVDLLGGEPLLVKDLAEIVALLAQQGRLTNMATNGLLLDKHVAELKAAGISRISISLYDTNRDILERSLAGINKVFPVHTSLVLFQSEMAERPEKLIETVQFTRDAGCLSLRFFMYRPMGLNPQQEEIPTDSQAYEEFRRRVEEVAPGFCVWPPPVEAAPVRKRCPQLWQRTGCDMQGNMAVCCGIEEPLSGADGNLFQAAPEDLYNHPVVVKMREQLLDPSTEPPEVCKTCNLLGDPGW